MAQQLVSEDGGTPARRVTITVDADLGRAILSSVADTDSRRIFECLLGEPKTTLAIGEQVRLPQSTLYRKISEMKQCGLLLIDSFEIKRDGKREARYSCAFTEIVFRVKGEETELEVVPTQRSIEKRWAAKFSGLDIAPPVGPASGGAHGREGAAGGGGGGGGGDGMEPGRSRRCYTLADRTSETRKTVTTTAGW